MSNMLAIMKDIQRMPYYQNYAASSGNVHNEAKHEDAVQDLLVKHHLVETSMPTHAPKTGLRDLWLDGGDHSELPDNSFIPQPCGTHKSPDFIVKSGGKLYYLECKSAQGVYPIYNSGLPNPKYIYIFCSDKTDETTVYRGQDILSCEQGKMLREHLEKARKADEELNQKLRESDEFKRGFQFYTRAMYNQMGGKDYVDYFLHSMRTACEQKVFDYVS